MEKSAQKYFRTRYPQVYQKLGNVFPFSQQVKWLVDHNQDVTARFQTNFDKEYDDDDDDYGKYYEEMVMYQTLPHKIEFEPLSLEIARRNIGKKNILLLCQWVSSHIVFWT